jgi:hypothetical protein
MFSLFFLLLWGPLSMMGCLRSCLLFILFVGQFFGNFGASALSTSERAIVLWNKLVGRRTTPNDPKGASPLPPLKYRGMERQACNANACQVHYDKEE